MRWFLRAAAALVVLYALLVGGVVVLMLQPPARFGRIMRHLPPMVIWGAVPATRIWLWARQGDLREGDMAPDFDLARHDGTGRVALSSHRGSRPVVLVFGSYT